MRKLLNRRFLVRAGRALGLTAAAAVLSGCIVVPAYRPHYFRPGPAYYYR